MDWTTRHAIFNMWDPRNPLTVAVQSNFAADQLLQGTSSAKKPRRVIKLHDAPKPEKTHLAAKKKQLRICAFVKRGCTVHK